MNRPICYLFSIFFVLSLLTASSVNISLGISTNRSGNIFSGDEDNIVLNTTVSGTANWTLTNNYGETITGSSPVIGGKVNIPIYGLKYDVYNISISGDGSLIGAVVPPLIELHPDLNSNIAGLFEQRISHTEDALMWKQIGMLEFRLEPCTGSNPPSLSTAQQNYCKALKQYGVRASVKLCLSDPPSNYDSFETGCRNFVSQVYPLGVESYYSINEPDGCGWWSGCWPEYLLVQERWYRAMKSAAPNAIMYAPEMCCTTAPGFIDPVLTNADHDVFSGHYPSDGRSGEVHSGAYFTRMLKTGYVYPMISGEAQDMNDNFDQADWAKYYPGRLPGGVGMCFDVTQAGHLDFGMHRQVHLGFILYGAAPFDTFNSNTVVPKYQCLQLRLGNDEMAGTQFIYKIPNLPPNVLGWIFKRGNDYYLQAYCPVGGTTQLMEIITNSSMLIVKDTFGNEYPAIPAAGKVYVMLANTSICVHGLSATDTINFIPRTTNFQPEILNPGPQTAVVGIPFRLKMQGRDPEMVITKWGRRVPTWSLSSAPSGMTIRPGSGLIQWTPSSTGNFSVTVVLTDSDGGSASQSFNITVLASGSNLPPEFVSRPAPAASLGKEYKYPARAIDSNGDTLTYSLTQGPAGMICSTTGYITWTPQSAGTYNVTVTADDGKGGTTTQSFELVVVPNPDTPAIGVIPPKTPTDLTVTNISAGSVTMVWNPHSFADVIVQRSTSKTGPWSNIATVNTPATWYRDVNPPQTGPLYYRVIAHNSGGYSEPSNVVNGRNIVPIADAGTNVKLNSGGTITLDGSGSYDPDNTGQLTYQWSIISAPIGSNPTLTNPTSAKPTLTIGQNGKYVVGLKVSDGQDVSIMDYLWVIVGAGSNERICDGGKDRFVTIGSTVTMWAWSSPYTVSDPWHWRLYDFPVYGHVNFAKQYEQIGASTNSFCPELPGVYWVEPAAGDDWMKGFPDYFRVIVSPVSTVGSATKLVLNTSNSYMYADGTSTVTITASVCDSNNNIVTSSTATITFSLSGSAGGTLVGTNPVQAVNGVATITYRSGTSSGTATVTGTSTGLTQGTVNITLTQPPQPTITVTYPNGGETWQTGTTQTVLWSSQGTVGNVNIDLSTDGGTNWTNLVSNTLNDGSQTVTVPNTPSSQCRIRVREPDGTPSDTSDNNFTISTTPPPPGITVIYPNGGETWTVGETRTVQWTSQGSVGNVNIDLSTNSGSTWTTLVSNTANDGSEAITVPNTPSSTCRIRVQEPDGSPSDISNSNFAIQSSGQTEPIISVSTTVLDFGTLDAGQTATLTFDITNTGSGTLTGSITTDQEWITVDPPSFVIPAQAGIQTINVTVDNSVLKQKEGQYTGTITITSNGGTATINVVLTATCVLVKPNPYNPNKGLLTFFGDGIVPGETTIKIYTLSGELVKVLSSDISLTDRIKGVRANNEIVWDGKNESGYPVMSGVYLYVYESSKEKGINKFTIIDKK